MNTRCLYCNWDEDGDCRQCGANIYEDYDNLDAILDTAREWIQTASPTKLHEFRLQLEDHDNIGNANQGERTHE